MVVLPVRGGATIKPRVPLPIGVTRSMMRVSIRSGAVSSLNFSIGSMVVRFSKADGLGVLFERHLIDLIDGLELRAVAAMRRLGRALDEAAFAQEIALDGVGRDENVRRFRVKMVFGGAQEAEAFFGDFEVTRAVVIGLVLLVLRVLLIRLIRLTLIIVPLIVVSMVVPMTIVVFGSCAHTVYLCVSRRRNRIIPENRL